MNHIIKYISIAIIAISTSCQNYDSHVDIEITDELLQGKWVLDSVNAENVLTNEYLFFVDGKMYRCSYWRNGYFIDSALYVDSKIDSYSDRVYTLKLLDSNKLLVKSRAEYYYKKVREDELQEAINKYRIGDELRENYIGFWEPVNTPNKPVEIMNHSSDCQSISFEIFNDGSSKFYINQNRDSAVYHSFRMRGESPQFSNGCLVGDYRMTWNDTKTQLGLVFSRFYADTIWFEKESR